MTDTMRAGPRSTRKPPLMSTPGGRFIALLVLIVVIALATLVSYFIFRTVSTSELHAAQARIVEVESQNQRLAAQLNKNLAASVDIQSKLKSVQDKLEAILPSQDTYNVTPNQAVVAGGGLLSIGLVGSPANNDVVVNVNGKQQALAAGDVLSVEPDAQTTCSIVVQSFDMFRALVHATCAKR